MVKTAKPRVKAKKPADKLMAKVPLEYVFWCHDGNIFTDIIELSEGLKTMSEETFAYHSNLEKHDFANWVRDVIEDERLADDLARASNRLEAAACVVARIT